MENSKIEWTHHTFNPWWGCTKVSAGCKHCYAETLSNRWKRAEWGVTGERKRTSKAYWREPLLWDKKAAAAGRRERVFCASMADVFENKTDQPELDQWRWDLMQLIAKTPHLDWLLLTKRPENALDFFTQLYQDEESWINLPYVSEDFCEFFVDNEYGINNPIPNIWVGTSVENQEQADIRIPQLLQIPASVRFLSMEPLLGAVDLSKWIGKFFCSQCGYRGNDVGDYYYVEELGSEAAECPKCTADYWLFTEAAYHGAFNGDHNLINWVIVGGESGPNARLMRPEWAREIRDQCTNVGVPFFFKQWGEWIPSSQLAVVDYSLVADNKYSLSKCAKTSADVGLMAMRSHWRIHTNGGFDYYRVGKAAAGRLLDGREWNEFPNESV